ncbi:hypothetical protein CF104_09310 [Aeromonas jandaei]|nr:hypothetical protein CF104_09310 [Aeromonas jandaei]
MMVALKVMAYFKISLSTRNWDRAYFFTLYPSRLFPLMVLQRPLPSLLQPPYSHLFLPVALR